MHIEGKKTLKHRVAEFRKFLARGVALPESRIEHAAKMNTASTSDATEPVQSHIELDQCLSDLKLVIDEIGALKRDIASLRTFLEDCPGVRSLHVEENTALVRLAMGPRMYVDSRDRGVGSWLMQQGRWEPQYTHQVRRLVKSGFTCIDAGAHMGYYTLITAKLVGPTGRVLAFEPNPRLVDLLRRSVQINGFTRDVVEVHQFALGDRNGAVELSFEVGQFGGGNIFATEANRRARNQVVANVDIRRLDDFEIDTSKPLFIKLDTEGAEYLIMKGAEKLLREISDVIIMMEFTPLFINKQLPVAAFLKYLRGFNFRFFTENKKDTLILVERNEREIEEMGNCYLFLARRDIAERH